MFLHNINISIPFVLYSLCKCHEYLLNGMYGENKSFELNLCN